MFISHLAFFISVLALILFFIRWVEHQFYERLMLLFIALNVVETGMWLYCNFYTNQFAPWSDAASILVENLSLVLPFFIIIYIGKKITFKPSLSLIAGLASISLLIYEIHLAFSNEPNNIIFYATNKQVTTNLLVQVFFSCICFIAFLIVFLKKPSITNDELFDGKFKRTLFWLFTAFFVHDLLFLLVLNNSKLVSRMHHLIQSTAFEVGNLLNLIIPLLLLLVSIYINWFYLLLRFKKNTQQAAVSWDYNKSSIQIIDLQSLPQNVTWNELMKTFQTTHPVCINYVEQLSFLSKTEKAYAFLAIFEFNQKELSDALFVSIRTIETNLYRLRSKLKKEGHELSFPYLKK
jgi:hypothetical protein